MISAQINYTLPQRRNQYHTEWFDNLRETLNS